ncbi:response regulator [Mesoaciditoga lauensis]|uniref:response regulator n=1 Tax=Mesoaciditoga lauensis TaxID=1495039 RepID=UPI00056035F6|nr:response regulator [Mesoaciditoga lauensis]
MAKILVVEDEEAMRMLIKEELEDEGYEVKTVSNGKEALNFLSSNDVDLITLDIEMPDMNGLEVAGKIREMKKNVKIILLTAYSHYKSDLSSWAADDYVVKSSDLSQLKNAVKKLLEV